MISSYLLMFLRWGILYNLVDLYSYITCCRLIVSLSLILLELKKLWYSKQ